MISAYLLLQKKHDIIFQVSEIVNEKLQYIFLLYFDKNTLYFQNNINKLNILYNEYTTIIKRNNKVYIALSDTLEEAYQNSLYDPKYKTMDIDDPYVFITHENSIQFTPQAFDLLLSTLNKAQDPYHLLYLTHNHQIKIETFSSMDKAEQYINKLYKPDTFYTYIHPQTYLENNSSFTLFRKFLKKHGSTFTQNKDFNDFEIFIKNKNTILRRTFIQNLEGKILHEPHMNPWNSTHFPTDSFYTLIQLYQDHNNLFIWRNNHSQDIFYKENITKAEAIKAIQNL